MKWSRIFCISLVMVCLLSCQVFASSGASVVAGDPVYRIYADSVYLEGEGVEPDYPVLYAPGSASGIVIGDNPPDDLLFYGSGWITGNDPLLGEVTLYFPISYQSGYWGLDSNGYLYNVSSSSMSGYLSGVYNNSVNAPAFSYPRYRTSSSSYDYVSLWLTPTNSNMQIATQSAPLYSVNDFLPYLIFLVGGVMILCFMKR